MKDHVADLYSALVNGGYNVDDLGGSIDGFREAMSDSAMRKEFYDWVGRRGNFRLPDYDVYESALASTYDGLKSEVSPEEAKGNADSINQLMENRDTLYSELQDYNTGIISGAEQRRRDSAASEMEAQAEAARQRLQEDGTIDRMKEAKKEARQNKRKGFLDMFGSAPAQTSFLTSPEDRQRLAQISEENAQKSIAEYSQNKLLQEKLDVALDMARAGENQDGLRGVENFGLGLWDSATRLSTWDFGASDIVNNLTLQQIVEKWENDPSSLTATEQKVLDGIGMATAVQELYSDQVGIGYNAGQSLPESASFMMGMALNPASGLGKSLARNAVRTYGRNSIAKNLARIGGDIAETAIMTATTGAGRVAADALERINGSSTYEIGENGVIMYGGQKDQETVGNAVIKAIGANFIENYSEALGEYFDPLLGMSRKVAAGGLRKMNLNKWADALSDVQPSQMTASIRSLREKTKFGGIFGEVMEEEIGMALNAISGVGDYTFSKEKADKEGRQWIFDLENQLTTVLSCAIMSGTLNGVEQVSSVAARRKMEKNAKNAEQYASYRFSRDSFAPLREAIDQASPEGMVDVLRDVYMSQEYTVGQKRALAEYAAARLQLQYYNAADAKARRQVNKTQQELLDAQEAGLNAQLPQFYSIARAAQGAEDDLVDYDGDWNLVEIIRSSMNRPEEMERILGDLPPREAQLVTNYIYSRARMEGAYQGRSNRAEDYVDDFAYALEPAVVTDTEGNRTITTAIMGDRSVYVLDNNGDLAHIMLPDGSKTLVKASELTNITTSFADEVIDRYRDMYTSEYNAETENAFEHHPKTQAPQVGLQLQSPEGEVVITAINDNMVEIVPAVYKDGQVQPKEGAEPRTITVDDAYAWQDDYYLSMDADQAYANAMAEANNMSAETAENEGTPTEEIEQSVSEEVIDGQNAETQPTEEVVESIAPAAPQTARERVPKDEEGNPIYEQTDADTAWDAIVEETEGDTEMAQRVAADMLEDKKAALEKLRKGKPKKGATVAEKIANEKAHQAAIAQAQNDVAQWEAIVGTESRRREAAMSEAERYAADMEQKNINEGLAALGEPQSLEEYVLGQLAGDAYKLRWSDKENGTKGFGSHTGLSTEEMKARLSMIDNKNGLTPEEVAHSIVENMDASFGEVDVMDVTNMVIDAVSTHASRRSMLNGMVESRAELLRQQEIAEQEAKDAWYMEQYHATEEELAAYNEYLAEFAEKIYGEDTDYEQRIATFAEIQLGYDNQGTDAGLRSSADQGEGFVSDRDGGRSVGETERLDRRELREDAAGVAEAEDGRAGGSVSAESNAERIGAIKAELGVFGADNAAEYADRLYDIYQWKSLEEANEVLKAVLRSYDRLSGQTLGVLPYLDQAQKLIKGSHSEEEIKENMRRTLLNIGYTEEEIAAAERDQQRYEADMAEDAAETVETLENGDVRRTNRNSNGEIATVVIERDGNVISVDTYEDGALFERTDYDANGNATKVTRYKDGEVVSEQEYKDGKRKVTADAFEMAEEAQKNRKSKKDKDAQQTNQNLQEERKEGAATTGAGKSRPNGTFSISYYTQFLKELFQNAHWEERPSEEVAGIIRRHNAGKTLLARTEDERELLSALRALTNNEIQDELSNINNALQSDKYTDEEKAELKRAKNLITRFVNRGERNAVIEALTGAKLGEKLPLSKIDELFEMYNSDANVAELYRRIRAIAEQIGLDFWFEEMEDSLLGGYLHSDNRVRLNAHMLYCPRMQRQGVASTIVHEMLHAVAGYAVYTQKDIKLGLTPKVQLSKQVLSAANTLINIYEKAVKGNPALVHQEYDIEKEEWVEVADYGTTSVHEMLSEISNPEFRDKLKQIEYKGRSVWQRIWDAIKSMFTQSSDVANPTAYDSMAKALDVLINEFSVDAYQKYSGLEENAMKLSSDDNLRFREKEEPKELIAVHNISEDNLKKVLEAGILIMPSIAITKADMGHTNFGEISLLFDKSTINPSDRRNKVYGGDAWTPRFPRIGVKLNDKVVSRINKKAYELIEDRRLREIFSISSEVYPDNIEKVISDYGVEGYYNKEWMKLAYLLDSGKRAKIPTKAKDYGIASEDIVRLAKEKGLSVKEIYEDYDFYKNNPDFVAQVKEARDEARLSSIPEEQRDEMRERMQSRPLSEAAFDSYIRGALEMEKDLANGGLKEVVDRQALRDLIEKKVKTDNAEYNKWVDNLFEGIVEKRGIRNNRDWYTPSGDLRPWGQLYDPATPANILKYMLAENEQGGSGGFFDSNIMGASAETYESIEEIREKGKKRLKQLPYEEYDEWSNSVAERMAKICDDFLSPSQKNSMGGAIDAKIEVTNAVAKDKTAKGIYKHMHREYPNFTMEHAKQVEEIVKEIQEFATGYFEAKPQRLVSVNEVMAAVVPSNASKEIVDALKNNGIEVVTYKKGDEEARKRVVKRVSSSLDIKFREGMGAISDREVSYENDPIAKFQGKPRYYGKRAAAFAERERRRMENAAKEAAEMLGIEAEIVTDASTLQGRKAKAKGWYDIVNKKVVVVVPNHVSMGDAVRTVLHEGIAHHGLRELFGDGFDAMLDNVYNNVAPELKARIDAIAERTGVSTSVATEEYMASLAEATNFEEAQRRGWWQEIKRFFVDMLNKLAMPGLNLKEELTDNELRYLLWRSYKNLVEPNSYAKPLGFAEDVVKQKELKVGEYAEKAPATPIAADTSEAEEWAAITVQRIDELEAQAAQLENEIAEMEADRDADDASRYEMWEQQLEPLRKQMEDVYAELEGLYSLEAEAEEMSMASEDAIRYRLVDDPAEIERLESEPTIKAYRAMQVINGELYPPMSAVVDGKLRKPIALGQWERSEEQPELADNDGNFKLNKGNKKSPVPARYNPYFHSSATPLNDQFAEAQDRPNLVTVEVEIPQSEADGTSGYKAEKAKDAVGTHQWKAGDIQGQLTGTRTLYLSRWDKPIRIVPDSEVAGVIAKMLEGTGIVMPSNVVTPSLRAELEKLGVPFVETTNRGKLAEGEHEGKGYGEVYGKKSTKKSKKKAEIISEVERESAALGVPVRIVRSVDELPDEDTRKRAVDGQLKGYFDPRTGEVVLYEPNTDDANDAKRTVLHEIVGHKGLRQLIGEQRYDKAMLQLMYMLPADVRDAVLRRAERHGWNAAIAMDEYLAEQAERDVQPTWWGKVNAKIRAILRNIGFDVKLTDADVTYLLWRSRKKLQGDSLNDMAVNAILKQAARKSADAEAWNEQAFQDAEMRDFEQGAMQTLRHRIGDAQNEYDSTMKSMAFKQRESWQDSMRSLKVFMDILEKESGKKIVDFENAYMYENAMSSANLMEMQMFRHDVYGRLLKAIHELMESGAKYEDVVDYMMAKHGLERNEKMARKRAEKEAEGDAAKEAELYAKYREEDLSGLTALTGVDNVADAEVAAMQMVTDFEAAHNTDLLWNETRACTQTILNISHDAGILSDEVYGELWNQYEYYIPLRGFDETTAEEMYTYVGDNKSPYNAPIKTAKGRKSKADDPIATIATMAESAIVEANRNRLKQRFLYMVERHRTELASVSSVWVEKDPITGDCVTRFANIPNDATPEEAAQAQKAFEEGMEQLHEQEPERYYKASEKPNIPYRVEKKANEHEHQIIVKRNGKDVVITINGDPRVAQAINGLTNPEAVEGFSKFAGNVNRFLSANFTTRNPAFVVSNFVRDGFYTNSMVWVKEGPAYARRYNQNWVKATKLLPSLVSKYKKYESGDKSALDMSDPVERAFYEFMIHGGETGYTVINSVEDYKGIVSGDLRAMQGGVVGNAKKAVQTVSNMVDTFGRWAEDTSRFAAYLTSRQMGRTVTRSIWDAKEISVNFNKKGSGRKMTQHDKGLNSLLGWMSQQGRNLYVFWNAGVQGLTNFGKAAKEHPGKMAGLVGAYFGLGMLVAAVFGGQDDDDDYWNLPEYVRRNNICHRVGDKWITLPLPIEIRAIYGMGELAMSWIAGKEDPKKIGMKIVQQVSQVAPIDMMAEGGGLKAFIPSWFKPIAEVYINTDWTGMPIYRKRTPFNEYDPTWMLAFKSTSPEYVAISRAINEATNENLPSGKENKYDRGWADSDYFNNPAAWDHVVEGYLGGLATTFNQTKKSVMALWNKDLREMRNIPVISRFVKSTPENEKNTLRNDYFEAKKEVDKLRAQRGRFRKESKNIDKSLTEEQLKDVIDSLTEMEEMSNATISKWDELEKDRKYLEQILKEDPEKELTIKGKEWKVSDLLDGVTREMITLVEAYRD